MIETSMGPEKAQPQKPQAQIYITVAEILFPTMGLFSAYIAFHGHLSPGGAFPAGVVLATAFLMRYISKIDNPLTQVRTAEEAENFAVLMILAIITTTLIKTLVPPEFLRFIPGHLFSAGEILSLNLIGTIEVSAALTVIIISFFLLGRMK